MHKSLVIAAMALVAACNPEFDTSSKTACLTDADCLDGRTCVLGPGGRFGVCSVRPNGVTGDADTPDSDIGPSDAEDDTELPTVCLDRDGDGVPAGASCTGPTDCDDGDDQVRPGAPELCNGVDDDCDGSVDEDFELRTSIEHCGACDRPCIADHGAVSCSEGRCIVESCDPGWWDRNQDGGDGCEQPCAPAEATCGDGRDDDCDGLADAADPDCAEPTDLAGRRFHLFWWHAAPLPAVGTAELVIGDAGRDARVTRRALTDLDRADRGRVLGDETWEITRTDPDRLVARRGAAEFTLFRSPAAPVELLVGVDTGRNELVVAVGAGRTGALPPVGHSWLAWVVSPYNELSTVPGGGAGALGWDEPVELALLEYAPTSTAGRGAVDWPFSEYRTHIDGDPDASGTLRPLAYRVTPDGQLDLELLESVGGPFDRVFDGAVTSAGDVAVAVHRFSGASCGPRLRVDEGCIHDPIVSFAVRRSVSVGPRALQGRWRLVGVAYSARSNALESQLRSLALEIDAAGAVTGDVTGAAGVFGSSDTFVPPTSRLDLRGDAVGGGTLTLEGHVTAGGIGVFWDQSGEVRARPMRGGVYFLVRERE